MKQNQCNTHGCHDEGCCSHEKSKCCCCGHEHSCGHGHHGHSCDQGHQEHQDFAAKLLEVADEAWMCALKERIRKQVEGLSGDHLDELAKIVSNANHNRWKLKTEGDKVCKDFKQQVWDFFNKK